MGREWLYKATSAVAVGGDGKRKSPSSPSATAKPINSRKNKDKNTSSSGCMSVIFNLFDLQHQQFRFHHPSFVAESESTITDHRQSCLLGNEARRSSSESPESAVDVAMSQPKVKEETNLNIPEGRIQIKTKHSRLFTDDLSSECSISPGTKTPNLVARLMGLDLLPESCSPRPSSSATPATTHHHTRSLPATPRASTASRRSTDHHDYHHHHHRLSLQINKENCNNCRAKQKDEKEIIKTEYVKQITNQVRERISRRLGTDITNTKSPARSQDRNYQRTDSDLVLLKPKKTIHAPVRLLDIKSNLNLNKPISIAISNSHVKLKSQTPKLPKSRAIKAVKDEKIQRIASERYDLRLKKNKKKLTNDGLNAKNTTKILGFKKEMTSCCLTARSSQAKVSLPASPNSPYKPDNTHNLCSATTASAYTAANTGPFAANIDRLVDGVAAETEVEEQGIVKEIESEIVENLVHEIVTEARSDMVRSWPVLFT